MPRQQSMWEWCALRRVLLLRVVRTPLGFQGSLCYCARTLALDLHAYPYSRQSPREVIAG